VNAGPYERIDACIDQDRIIEFFKSLIKIPSPRFGETELAHHIGTFLAGIGARVEYQMVTRGDVSTEQVIGRWGRNKGGKRVLLNAHMDAGSGQYQGLVFQPEKWTKDPFNAVVEDGYIYGVGTHNNKQGITAIVMALDALVKSGLEVDGEVIVACVVAETVCGVGAAELVKNGLKADVAVVAEGTGLDVVNNSVGKIRGRFLVKGEHAHHSVHVSPVENLRYLLEAFSPGYGDNFAKSFLTGVPDPALPKVPNAAIRWVASDLKDLDRCLAFFDVVCVPSMTPTSVEKDLRRIVQAIHEKHPTFAADIDMGGWEPPFSENHIWGAGPTAIDSDIVKTVARHHEAVRGKAPDIGPGRRFGGASDAMSFRKAGIRTVEYGPGSIGKDGDLATWPAIDERVRVDAVVACTQVLARATYELANQAR
jgi:acetylornithine deacetylase/succinyl-diaminopimelate desuccinylase-like protein